MILTERQDAANLIPVQPGADPAGLPVCDEFPVQLELNGEPVVTLLCTPSALTELALGWLYCEGMIEGLDEVLAVGGCDQLSRMRVFADAARPVAQSEWRRVITSGCGSGHAIDPAELAKLPPVTSDLTFPLPRLEALMREVAIGGPIKRAVGGVLDRQQLRRRRLERGRRLDVAAAAVAQVDPVLLGLALDREVVQRPLVLVAAVRAAGARGLPAGAAGRAAQHALPLRAGELRQERRPAADRADALRPLDALQQRRQGARRPHQRGADREAG